MSNDLQRILSILRAEMPYLSREFHGKRIGIFGSYSQGAQTDDSDVDLIVEFKKPVGFKFIELNYYLESLLGKSVDMLTPAGVQTISYPEVAESITQSIVYV
jgi:predicted nucleotidyltransferase